LTESVISLLLLLTLSFFSMHVQIDSEMASSTLAASPSQPQMDCVEMDAAHALIGVLPSADEASHSEAVESASHPVLAAMEASSSLVTTADGHQSSSSEAAEDQVEISSDAHVESRERPPSGGGLDALAALASKEQAAYNNSPLAFHLAKSGVASASPSSASDDDSEHAMPPPPPRYRRRRSASNPEGMEKWDSLNREKGSRRHFVLPESILEEELAEASAAIREQGRKIPQQSIPEDEEVCDTDPHSTLNLQQQQNCSEADDTENVTPEELLRRARSRLLEDLSEGNMNGDKGMLTLPHSLAKYKEVYNKNGRIGIYTPSERAAIIARFNKKRSRRVWNKKIRYNCRKSLADRRLRVKGRFVKRSEQEQMRKQLAAEQAATEHRTSSPESNPAEDEEMPDVNDPEAGFSPTEDQPYRRLRRHTIT